MVNFRILKGELYMYTYNLLEEERNKLHKLVDVYKNNGSMPLSQITNLCDRLDINNEMILNYSMNNIYIKKRNYCKQYKINIEFIKNRQNELGWSTVLLAPLISDFENSYRAICSGLDKLYGYEINNLCYYLECNISDIVPSFEKKTDVATEPIVTKLCNFKLDSNKLKLILNRKNLNLDKFALNISSKYKDVLLNSNPTLSYIIIDRLCKYIGCNREELEYKEIEDEEINDTTTDDNTNTKVWDVSNRASSIKKNNSILIEKVESSESEIQELNTKTNLATDLLQIALDNQSILKLFKEISTLDERDRQCILDTLNVLLDRFR